MKRPPEGTGNPFETYEELIEQSLYSYGTVARSAIDRFFSVSYKQHEATYSGWTTKELGNKKLN